MSYKINLIDIHGHYVFGVDDGASTLQMSLDMVKSAYNQGIRYIFCTSHDNAHIPLYRKNLKILNEALNSLGIEVTLYSGSEILCEEDYIDEIIYKLNNGELLSMGNSKYILLEFSPWTITEEIMNCVSKIRSETKYEPIIAHIERYFWLRDDPKILNVIKEMRLLIQINAYSLVEESNDETKAFARKLLEEQLVTFIGSDAHRSDHRPVNLSSGVGYIFRNCEEKYAEDICYNNAKSLLVKSIL